MKSFNEFLKEKLNQNFKIWFGKSKVLKNGKPQIVYHGTDKDFDTFSRDKMRQNFQGFQFTDDKEFAFGSYGNKGKSVYLRIEKPYYVHDGSEWFKAITDKSLKSKYDGIIGKWTIEETGSYMEVYMVYKPNQIKSASGNNSEYSNSNESIYK